ncbi:MAG: triacylglycerol lipase [Pedobacter sp.]|nr:triacylglycerol lipase [Pedobacter sp.]
MTLTRALLALLLTLPFAAAHAADTYTKTRYPVVLAHGMFGWDKLAGTVEYWYGIPAALGKGGTTVYTTQVGGLESSEARGEQLLTQVQDILAISGADKVNLIGHSHGGHSVRYVGALIPNRIASVSTVGTPAQGSPVADLILSAGESAPAVGSVAYLVLNAANDLLKLLTGDKTTSNAKASIYSLSSRGSAEFTANYPQAMPSTPCGQGAAVVSGVRYYSWGSTSVRTNVLDPVDILFSITSLAFKGAPNDGMVGQCSSHVGLVLRDNYKMNHFDQVNQFFGLRDIFGTDPVAVFREHGNRLKLAGL